jgi:hypothetical protein
MDQALLDNLRTTLRTSVTGTFGAAETGVLDAGCGRSFVGLFIETALGGGTTLTFSGYGGGDDQSSTPAASALHPVKNLYSDGSASTLYTIEVAAETGCFPLDPQVFNGCRYLIVESDVDNTASTIKAISKAL